MASTRRNDERLIWIDLEMTGLDTDRDSILEIATLVTDTQLNVLAEGPELAIAHPLSRAGGDGRVEPQPARQVRACGSACSTASVTLAEAEASTLAFLTQWVPAGTSPMCGNSICQDRRFLHRLMPRLERYFHYRNLDVSTVKELARRWAPDVLAGVQQGCAAYRAERRARFHRRAAPLPRVDGEAGRAVDARRRSLGKAKPHPGSGAVECRRPRVRCAYPGNSLTLVFAGCWRHHHVHTLILRHMVVHVHVALGVGDADALLVEARP